MFPFIVMGLFSGSIGLMVLAVWIPDKDPPPTLTKLDDYI
jgi:hypothetical protein